jgi:chorismate-pyruvate lyase
MTTMPLDAVDPLELVETFYDQSSELARLIECTRPLPAPYGQLLDHEEHMTETVEAFHGCTVGVQVLRIQYAHHWYTREITLHCHHANRPLTDSPPVLYGIVRLRPDLLQPHVWAEIESQQTPLGHVLITHNVHRRVALERLWRVEAGPALRDRLRLPESFDDAGCSPWVTYGRTARIVCDGLPAIDLLEIVAPATSGDDRTTL